MKRLPILAILAASLLAACIRVNVGGGSGGEAPAIYRLSAPAPPPDLPRVNWQLVVDRPTAARELDGQRILWIDAAGRLSALPRVQWSDRTPDLLQGAILELLERSGAIGGIDRPESGLRGDYVLLSEIRGFELREEAGRTLAARIALGLRLLAPARNRIVAATLIEASAPASDRSEAALVRAFQQAFAEVVAKAAAWTLSVGEANRISGPPAPGP